jgi:hypothetical protein
MHFGERTQKLIVNAIGVITAPTPGARLLISSIFCTGMAKSALLWQIVQTCKEQPCINKIHQQ